MQVSIICIPRECFCHDTLHIAKARAERCLKPTVSAFALSSRLKKMKGSVGRKVRWQTSSAPLMLKRQQEIRDGQMEKGNGGKSNNILQREGRERKRRWKDESKCSSSREKEMEMHESNNVYVKDISPFLC